MHCLFCLCSSLSCIERFKSTTEVRSCFFLHYIPKDSGITYVAQRTHSMYTRRQRRLDIKFNTSCSRIQMPVLSIRYTDLKLKAETCGVQTPVRQEHFIFSLSVQKALWCPPSLHCGTVALYQGSSGWSFLLSSRCPPSAEFKERVELHL